MRRKTDFTLDAIVGREWLGDTIVSTHLRATDPVYILVHGGHHDYRHRVKFADLMAGCKSGHLGQPDI